MAKKLVTAANFPRVFLDAAVHDLRVVAGRSASLVVKDLMVVLIRLLVRSCSSEKLPPALTNAISKKFLALIVKRFSFPEFPSSQFRTTTIAGRAEHEMKRWKVWRRELYEIQLCGKRL